jgi:F-type H+-transporting ATPase subunit b
MHHFTTRFAGLVLVALSVLSAASAHAASEGGLELVPDFSTTLPALLVAFVLLVFPVNVLLIKPILKALDERDERIEGTRVKAERLAREGQAVLERYESALREAREESELERRSRLDAARESMLETTSTARTAAEAELERARGELASTLDDARATLRAYADELAREAATSVLGRPV